MVGFPYREAVAVLPCFSVLQEPVPAEPARVEGKPRRPKERLDLEADQGYDSEATR